MYHSTDSSPTRMQLPLHTFEEHGTRKFKPLPKRRRVMELGGEDGNVSGLFSLGPGTGATTTTTTTSTSTTTTTTAPDRSWSITANFPNVDKVMNMNTTITREQFMAHAGELAKRLTHQLQGRLSPGDRMEFIQAMLQQQQQLVHQQTQAGAAQDPAGSLADNQGLPPLLPLPGVDALSGMGPSATYSVSVPVPALSPDAKFDLDAVFAAGFEAGLAGAVGGFDPFDDSDALQETWEEVAEVYYSHRSPTHPPSTPGTGNVGLQGGPPSQVSSDLGRRSARDAGDEDDEEGEGDYDQLRQPGNTKKRKVPANVGASPGSRRGGGERDEDDPGGLDGPGHGYGGVVARRGVGQRDEGDDGAGGDGQAVDKSLPYGSAGAGSGAVGMGQGGQGSAKPLGRLPLSALSTFASTAPSSARVGQLRAIVKARGKLAGAMVAGIQHKEMLKARKRQLAAVMGVLSGASPSSPDSPAAALARTDSLALDQALAMVGSLPPPSSMARTALAPKTPNVTQNGAAPGAPVGDKRKAEGDGKENVDVVARAKGLVGMTQNPAVRLSRRVGARMARTAAAMGSTARKASTVPSGTFTFSVDSATKDRLIATKDEVITLRKRFEAELDRQAASAAKLAAASKALVAAANANPTANAVTASTGTAAAAAAPTGTPSKGAKQKKTKAGASPTKPKKDAAALSAGAPGSGNNANKQPASGQTQQPQPQQQAPRQAAGNNAKGDQGVPPIIPSSKPKKKKRSAMANASNPHHLRNYVPSRLPHSGDGGHHGVTQNGGHGLFGPLPLRFLNAELPRKGGDADGGKTNTSTGKKKGAGGNAPGGVGAGAGGPNSGTGVLTVPVGDEWICAFCEYDLFYGDDVAFRRAVGSRKKILKRRRRARERAAAAANGVKTFGKGGAGQTPPASTQPPGATAADNTAEGQSEEEEEYDLDDFDGNPGYEAGGDGRDEFGNVPKHQTSGKPGGGGGAQQERTGPKPQAAAAAG